MDLSTRTTVDAARDEGPRRKVPVATTDAAASGGPEVGAPVAWLRGELDVHELDALVTFLCAVADSDRTVILDLSGITFLDLGSARELALSHLRSPALLMLCNPSWQAVASFAACGFGNRIEFLARAIDFQGLAVTEPHA